MAWISMSERDLKRIEVLSEVLAGRRTQLEVRWKGISLPYRVFSEDRRVSHAAIVENKRLGRALAMVKAEQDLKQQTKVKTNSEKDRYKKRARKVYGPDYDSDLTPAAMEMPA